VSTFSKAMAENVDQKTYGVSGKYKTIACFWNVQLMVIVSNTSIIWIVYAIKQYILGLEFLGEHNAQYFFLVL